MKKGSKKEPEMTRIIAIDGSDILKHGITTRKNGKLYPDAFRGVLDESLDTLKMKEIFKRHKAELPFPYLENKQFCRAVVNVLHTPSSSLSSTGAGLCGTDAR